MNPAWSHRRGPEPRWPSLAASVALHVLVVAVIIVLGRPVLKMAGVSVPINIVATGPVTDSRAAEQAPRTQAAATEQPVAQAPPTPPTPAAPTPAPPQPTPSRAVAKPLPVKPSPARDVAQPTPAPTRPAKAQPTPAAQPAFDLNRLQDSINHSVASAKAAKASSAPRGPTRAETAPQARPAVGQGISTSDIEGLGQLLNRLWNPNCGTNPIDLDVRIVVDQNGHVQADAGGQDHSPDSAIAASAIRAKSAVHKVEPYDPKYRGQSFMIKFDASKACANR